jgi:hypothetical protein
MMVTRQLQLRPQGYSKGRNEGNPMARRLMTKYTIQVFLNPQSPV